MSCLVLERTGEGVKGRRGLQVRLSGEVSTRLGMTGTLGALKKALNPSSKGRGAVKSRQKARKYKYVNTHVMDMRHRVRENEKEREKERRCSAYFGLFAYAKNIGRGRIGCSDAYR